MNTIKKLLTNTKYQVSHCHKRHAYEIDNQLKAGTPYYELNGKKIRRNKSLIRFKIGRNFRLIYQLNNQNPEPLMLISRQHFDKQINRR